MHSNNMRNYTRPTPYFNKPFNNSFFNYNNDYNSDEEDNLDDEIFSLSNRNNTLTNYSNDFDNRAKTQTNFYNNYLTERNKIIEFNNYKERDRMENNNLRKKYLNEELTCINENISNIRNSFQKKHNQHLALRKTLTECDLKTLNLEKENQKTKEEKKIRKQMKQNYYINDYINKKEIEIREYENNKKFEKERKVKEKALKKKKFDDEKELKDRDLKNKKDLAYKLSYWFAHPTTSNFKNKY